MDKLRQEPKNEAEQISEQVAREKLDRIFGDEFRDFAIRFVNIAEYEEMMRDHIISGGNAYAPKIKTGEHPESSPTFSDYLKNSLEKPWQEIIGDETDWMEGALSVSMYNHILDLLKEARKKVQEGNEDKEDYRARIVDEFKNLLEAEARKEIREREELGWDPDFNDTRYEILMTAIQLPAIKREMDDDAEALRSSLGEGEYEKLLALCDSESRGLKNIARTALPESINQFIERLSPEHKNEILQRAGNLFSLNIIINSLGGLQNIELVERWLENPRNVNLRTLINTVTTAQLSYYESSQYNLALVFDFQALEPKEPEPSDRAYGGWGSLLEGKSTDNILAAISIMSDKETLNKIIARAREAGSSSHAVLDNHGKVRFPA